MSGKLLAHLVAAGLLLASLPAYAETTAPLGTNLIPNPSFETAATDGSLPEGWSIAQASQLDPAPILYPDATAPEWANDPGARTGNRHLKFVVDSASTERTTLRHEGLISVKTDTDYRLQMAYRFEDVDEAATSIEKSRLLLYVVHYYDANPGGEPDPQPFGQQTLAYDYVDSVCCGSTPPAEVWHWTLREKDISFDSAGVEVDGVIRQVRWIQLELEPNRWFRGTAAFDDLSMVELASAEFEPPTGSQAYDFIARECNSNSENSGASCLADAECPGKDTDDDGISDVEGVCVTHEATAGFTPVPFNRQFSGEGGDEYGFEFESLADPPLGYRRSDYPTRLSGSHLDRQARFRVALAPGSYRVSVYMGGYWRSEPTPEMHAIDFNGDRLVDETSNWTEAYSLKDHWYFKNLEATLVTSEDVMPHRRGYAVYDNYIAPRYRRHDVDVTVGGEGEFSNLLEIENANGFMAGAVITPIAEQGEHDSAIAAFELRLPEEFVSRFATYVAPEDFGLPTVQGDYTPSSEDEERGYVIFKRHWMDFVEFNSRPDSGEAPVTELSLVATPGEFEPTAFSIWPRQQLENATVTVTDLQTAGGQDTISAEAVQILYLQQKPRRSGTTFSFVGVYLPDWGTSRTLYPDVTQRAHLNVKVPEDAPSGLYTGQVTFAADGVDATVLPLTVEVRPFRLQRPPHVRSLRGAGGSKLILMYPSSDPDVPGEEEPPIHNREYYRKAAYQDLHDHGFTPDISPYFGGPANSGYWDSNGDFVWSYGTIAGSGDDQLDRFDASPFGSGDTVWIDGNFDEILEAFEGNPNSAWNVADAAQWLAGIEAKLHGERGLTTIHLHISSEESHYNPPPSYPNPLDHPRAQAWLQCLDFIETYRETGYDGSGPWPHVFTAHTTNTDWGQPEAIDHTDFPFLGMFHGVTVPAPSEQVAAAQASGKPFGIYGLRGRFVTGFYHWKAGATGSYHEFYDVYRGGLNDDWDNSDSQAGENPGWTNALYSQTGRMVGSWHWEELREGVDDDAYLATLDHWIERYGCEENATGACANALVARQAIADAIDLDTSAFAGDPEDLETVGRYGRLGMNLIRPIEPAAFDALRAQAADAIAALLGPDSDGDWMPDEFDNCLGLANIGQEDTDGDGIGDACNDAEDADGDEIADVLDNCVADANAGQDDTDGNGTGDACNSGEDTDGDDWADILDNCLAHANPSQADANFDGYGNHCDADTDDNGVVDDADYASVRDAIFSDYDDEGYFSVGDLNADGAISLQDVMVVLQLFNSNVHGLSGLACAGAAPGDIDFPCRSRSDDADGDGFSETSDTCPSIWNPSQNDICPDPDGDGVPGSNDNCPEVPNAGQEDADGNGLGDVCNGAEDTDGDDWSDALDNCPAVPNSGQEDTNADFVGDACDLDGDGWADTLDNCPAVANSDQSNMDLDSEGDVCDFDVDGDFLLDAVESGTGIYVDETDTGTDPLKMDSDDDGVADGVEVLFGTDPNSFDATAVPFLSPLGTAGLATLMLGGALGVLRRRR